MSTPETKLDIAVTKVKTLWQRWEIYAVFVGGFILGAVVGHKL